MSYYDRVRVIPYQMYSQSAKALANALGAKRIKLEGSRFKPKPNDLIINWGNSRGPVYDTGTTLNRPACVAEMADKLSFFRKYEGRPWLPPFWTNSEEIPDEAFPIVCRTVLNGHSGSGIVIADVRDNLVPAPLYVKYIPKKDEYRVHLGAYDDGSGGLDVRVIGEQKKKRTFSNDNPNWQIRNHANGFIYARQDIDTPNAVLKSAVDCFTDSGLDFCAVDVIYQRSTDRAYVLEVNTAPGLVGSTLDDYLNFFKEAMQ